MAEPRAARVELGWVGPSEPGDPEALAGWLDGAEMERAAGFGSAARRREFLLGRALLRRILGERFGVAREGLAFVPDERGRLAIASPGPEAPSVSVSHSHGFVAAAASVAGTLGIDLERLRDVARAEAIARRWFSEAECRQLAEREGADRSRHFLALWTLKESQLKATGQGLAGGTKAFGFAIGPDGRALATGSAGEDPGPWSFRSFVLSPDAVGAVALRTAGAGIELATTELPFFAA